MGHLNRLTGDYEKARSNYAKALLIEPGDLSILLSQAKIDAELGDFQKALSQYHDALASCKTPEDHFKVYTHLEEICQLRGQIQQSLEYMELKFTAYEKYAPPILILDQKIESLGKYIRAGKIETANQVLQETEAQMVAPPMDRLVPLLYLDYYLEMKDIDHAEEAMILVETVIQELQMEILRSGIFESQGKIFELKEEYELAIESYTQQLELDPTNSNIHLQIGHCYRKIQEYKKAEEGETIEEEG